MDLKSMALGSALMTAILGGTAAADCVLPAEAQAGKADAILCKTCHEFDAAKPSKTTAPNLHDVFGSTAASRKDFKYSEAMRAASDKDLVWTDTTLFDYLADPKVFLTTFNGAEYEHLMKFRVVDEQKRRDVIAYLKAIKGKPACN